jgi:hypothetical protein
MEQTIFLLAVLFLYDEQEDGMAMTYDDKNSLLLLSLEASDALEAVVEPSEVDTRRHFGQYQDR